MKLTTPASALPLLLLWVSAFPAESFQTTQHVQQLLPQSKQFSPLIRNVAASGVNGDNKDTTKTSSPPPSRKTASRSSSSDESTNYNFIGLNTDTENPYVPSGLSPEQYEQIKQDEAAKTRKMDFGAWGPRFQKSDAPPDGDWMVQTNLWVRGFAANGNDSSGKISTSADQDAPRRRKQQLASLRTTLASMILVYSVLEIAFLSLSTPSAFAKFISLGPGSILQSLQQPLLVWTKLWASLKLNAVKLSLVTAVAAIAAPLFVNKYREIANRRWFWSQRKVVGIPLAAAVGMLAVRMVLSAAMAGTV